MSPPPPTIWAAEPLPRGGPGSLLPPQNGRPLGARRWLRLRHGQVERACDPVLAGPASPFACSDSFTAPLLLSFDLFSYCLSRLSPFRSTLGHLRGDRAVRGPRRFLVPGGRHANGRGQDAGDLSEPIDGLAGGRAGFRRRLACKSLCIVFRSPWCRSTSWRDPAAPAPAGRPRPLVVLIVFSTFLRMAFPACCAPDRRIDALRHVSRSVSSCRVPDTSGLLLGLRSESSTSCSRISWMCEDSAEVVQAGYRIFDRRGIFRRTPLARGEAVEPSRRSAAASGHSLRLRGRCSIRLPRQPCWSGWQRTALHE